MRLSASLALLPFAPKKDSSSDCEMLESPSLSMAETMSDAASDARPSVDGGGGGGGGALASEFAKDDSSSELMLSSPLLSMLSNSDCSASLDDVVEVESTDDTEEVSLVLLALAELVSPTLCCNCSRSDMISWLSVLPEELEVLESDEVSSLGGGGGMNCVLELDSLALVVLELAARGRSAARLQHLHEDRKAGSADAAHRHEELPQ